MEFYSAIKKNESMLFASKQMELENIMFQKQARTVGTFCGCGLVLYLLWDDGV
jgi:hypothetical protein